MEITPVKKDETGVERRKNLPVFGRAAQEDMSVYIRVDPNPVKFVRRDIIVEKESKKGTGAYKFVPGFGIDHAQEQEETQAESGIYKPPTSAFTEPVSVKISNLPSDLKQEALLALLTEKTDFTPRYVRIITDKETGDSLRFAYATFNSEADAKLAVEQIDKIEIGPLVLSADIPKRR